LRLARHALRKGGAFPCAFNAADEIAVAAFLERRLAFPAIAQVIEHVLDRTPRVNLGSIAGVLEADREARRMACEEVAQIAKSAA
jgi:1-deoxy-D-xylulose-5-phosphate reductoisomerase